MNNIVLNVAIGLVFIYLLYSLLATTIKEFIATLFSYRARMLEKGLEQMLDGKSYSYYWWDRVWNYINKSNRTKTTSKFYIKNNLFTSSISCHPLYVRSGENSSVLKNKKPAYLSADVFSDILIDILKPDKDVPALLKDIAASVKERASNKNDPLNNGLGKILNLYIEQANGDLQRFKLLIETWYNDTMDRVGGWYKRQANRILIGIGFCLAVAFNVSTIDIVKQLSSDKDVRNALVNNATEYVKNHIDKVKPVTKDYGDTAKNSGNTKPLLKAAGDTSDADTTFEALRLKVDSLMALYNNNIAEANTTMGLGWGDFGYTEDSINYKKDSLQYIKDSTACADNLKSNPKYDCSIKNLHKPKEPSQPGILKKVWFAIFKSISTPHYLLGFLITAFAVSLGAPFWFDLLNRFVNLRVSGAKPEEGATPVSKTALLNQKPDPTAKG